MTEKCLDTTGEIKRQEGEAVGTWEKLGTSLEIKIKLYGIGLDPTNIMTHAHWWQNHLQTLIDARFSYSHIRPGARSAED